MILAIIIVAAVVVLFIVVPLVFLRDSSGVFPGIEQEKKLLTTGQAAQAKVVQAEQSDMTLNEQPMIDFVLEVQPESGQAFQTETSQVISAIHMPKVQPGNMVKVRYDPADPTKVAIDFR